jgi:hypothetical protein
VRKTIYISERRHKKVVEFVKSLPKQDISYELVRLMEDGMKWRESGKDEGSKVASALLKGVAAAGEDGVPPLGDKQEKPKADFSGIKLERRKINKGDLESRLNSI